jgi:hemoglobin-like flavoprotein
MKMEKFITGEQIKLVKTSFAKIEPLAEEAGVLFYARLFELDPNLRPLFTGDIREQGSKLLEMLGMAVRALDNFDAIVPIVRESGIRHAGYGVEEHHYETVAEALFWTFEEALDEDFTTETKEAWMAVYNHLAWTMKNAARHRTEKNSDKL